jgi:U6 snRNA-associated Sm-like protein LSm1
MATIDVSKLNLTGTASLAEELDSASRFLSRGAARSVTPATAPPAREPPHVRTPPAPAFAEKLMVVLRDGRKIIGTMSSFDQFANIVLEHALERVIVGKRFADVPLGLYVIRGENVVLLGQIDDEKERDTTENLLERVKVEDILQLKEEQAEARKQLKAASSRQLSKQTEPWADHFDY